MTWKKFTTYLEKTSYLVILCFTPIQRFHFAPKLTWHSPRQSHMTSPHVNLDFRSGINTSQNWDPKTYSKPWVERCPQSTGAESVACLTKLPTPQEGAVVPVDHRFFTLWAPQTDLPRTSSRWSYSSSKHCWIPIQLAIGAVVNFPKCYANTDSTNWRGQWCTCGQSELSHNLICSYQNPQPYKFQQWNLIPRSVQ